MTGPSLRLFLLQGDYSICKLPADASVPTWADGDGFVGIARGDGELSVTCRSERVPTGIQREAGWSAIKLDNLLGLDEPGAVLAAVQPISTAGHGVFVMSTFLRDYLLVRTNRLAEVQKLLEQAGHQFEASL